MRLAEWLEQSKDVFVERDLRFLLKDVLGESYPLISEQNHLDFKETQFLDKIKKLYLQGMPLAYILSKEDFYGLEFEVDNRTLIPRPETELIVERAIELIEKNNLRFILDLCCGCGNIAISIKKSGAKDLIVFSSDISSQALELAKANKEIHKENIRLINTDLLNAFKYKSFDLIVSNPPYVEDENIRGTLKFEPELALRAGKDGLYFIDRILNQAHRYLKAGGYLIMEVGSKHKEAVNNLIQKGSRYEKIEWIRDYSGHWRGVVLRKSIVHSR